MSTKIPSPPKGWRGDYERGYFHPSDGAPAKVGAWGSTTISVEVVVERRPTEKVKMVLPVGASLLVAAVVSSNGIIDFVGAAGYGRLRKRSESRRVRWRHSGQPRCRKALAYQRIATIELRRSQGAKDELKKFFL